MATTQSTENEQTIISYAMANCPEDKVFHNFLMHVGRNYPASRLTTVWPQSKMDLILKKVRTNG